MKVIGTPEEVHKESLRWKHSEYVALVPTMGALHEGHLSLVRRAKRLAPRCIVSIFVNPLQFGPNEDLSKYPRTFEEDCRKLEKEGVDAVFAPSPETFYPAAFASKVNVSHLSEHLCGRSRPGHFEGVATVCLKLFLSTAADFAIFGEKDFQQWRVLQRMVSDLNVPIRLVAQPIVRETDGLAMSSRNRYLSADERQAALAIPASLQAARDAVKLSEALTVGELTKTVRDRLSATALRIEYCDITSETDLVPQAAERRIIEIEKPRLFVAVKSGATRLIDNMSLGKEGT
jgi:pantoate--beta-alanine ligase